MLFRNQLVAAVLLTFALPAAAGTVFTFKDTNDPPKTWTLTIPAGWHVTNVQESLDEGGPLRIASADSITALAPMPTAGTAVIVVVFTPLGADGRPTIHLFNNGLDSAQVTADALSASIQQQP